VQTPPDPGRLPRQAHKRSRFISLAGIQEVSSYVSSGINAFCPRVGRVWCIENLKISVHVPNKPAHLTLILVEQVANNVPASVYASATGVKAVVKHNSSIDLGNKSAVGR
jgi:hypothetical protein